MHGTGYLEGRDVCVAGSAGVHYLYETQARCGRGRALLLERSAACLGEKAEQKQLISCSNGDFATRVSSG